MLIPLEPYSASWHDDFESIAGRLWDCFGNEAIRIDHIGSTAVEGLAAKPVIDIQVTVQALDSIPLIVESVLKAGFEYRAANCVDRPPPWEESRPEEWKKMYFKSLEGESPRAQVHVREVGRRNQRYALLFRDYLRAHRHVRDAYGQFKLKIADLVGHASRPGGTGPYLDLKDPFFDVIIFAAERWAEEVDWNGRV